MPAQTRQQCPCCNKKYYKSTYNTSAFKKCAKCDKECCAKCLYDGSEKGNMFRSPIRTHRRCQKCKDPICKACLNAVIENLIKTRKDAYKKLEMKTPTELTKTSIHVIMDAMLLLKCTGDCAV